MKLEGRHAVIVGSRRIGREIALRLADLGVNIGILYRSSAIEAEKLVQEVHAKSCKAACVQSALETDAEVSTALDQLEAMCGPASFLINLASDYDRTPFDALDAAAWDRGMSAARANYLLAIHAAQRMKHLPGPTRGHLLQFGDWASGFSALPHRQGGDSVHDTGSGG
jgi:NAD(P)-dependent dehydrogenase (short-subunit alcohol dehydrogenase family)